MQKSFARGTSNYKANDVSGFKMGEFEYRYLTAIVQDFGETMPGDLWAFVFFLPRKPSTQYGGGVAQIH